MSCQLKFLKWFESQIDSGSDIANHKPFSHSTYFCSHHLSIFAIRLSLVAGACSPHGLVRHVRPVTPPELHCLHSLTSECMNAPAPSPLRWDISGACGLLSSQASFEGLSLRCPQRYPFDTTALFCYFPSMPQLPTNVSWTPFLDKLLALRFLSQGQLWGNPNQSIAQCCSIHRST